MSDHDGRNMEASVLAEQKESRERQERLKKTEVLRRTVEGENLRAEMEALQAEVARGAGGGRSGASQRQRRRLLCQHLG